MEGLTGKCFHSFPSVPLPPRSRQRSAMPRPGGDASPPQSHTRSRGTGLPVLELHCSPHRPSALPKPNSGRSHSSHTHIFQGDDVWMLPVSQEDFYFLRRVSLALVNNLQEHGPALATKGRGSRTMQKGECLEPCRDPAPYPFPVPWSL